jgi:hypothetical protein
MLLLSATVIHTIEKTMEVVQRCADVPDGRTRALPPEL